MSNEYQNQYESQSSSLRRQLVLSWVLMLLLVVMLVLPSLKLWFNLGVTGEPRMVTPRGALADYEQSTVELFRETSPSVVYINTRAKVADRFSRRVVEVDSGTGSGFVWDKQGHIVTNFHVIRQSTSYEVVFYDQSRYDAELIGASADHDLAVLRIVAPESALRPVLIGESSDLQVGQSVFAIGNPFGLDQTLTTGVVSAKTRNIEAPSGDVIEDVIQIDAAINPGNSGGPLLDSAARLIGVNTAIYSPSGTSAGVGFAIPVDTVNRVVPEIIERGAYEPPRLGIEIDARWDRIVRLQTGIEGVAIVGVVRGGPAEAAGLRPLQENERNAILGDVIVGIDDRKVSSGKDLLDALQNYQRGDTVSVRIIRDRKETSLKVKLS